MKRQQYAILIFILVMTCLDIGTVVPYFFLNGDHGRLIAWLSRSKGKGEKSQVSPARKSGSESRTFNLLPNLSSSFRSTSAIRDIHDTHVGAAQSPATLSNASGASAQARPLYNASKSQAQSYGNVAHASGNSTIRKYNRSNAADYNIGSFTLPTIQFSSTSSLLAANNTATDAGARTARRNLPPPPPEPDPEEETPIGDVPWALLLIAASVMIALRTRKLFSSTEKTEATEIFV